MKEARKEAIEWDKKKIILFTVGAIILLGIGLVVKEMMFAGVKTQNPSSDITSVKGASTEIVNPLPDIKQGIQNQMDSLKNEAQNINVVDIATSSPQVQKVINDLKAIQDYPKSQLKTTCENICNKL
jgi:conjugal transfer/entry exclusion protein